MNKVTLSHCDIDEILYTRLKNSGGVLTLNDLPAPDTFDDMIKASKRVANAIMDGEKILIVGDYDVDGVVSTTIMRDFFDEIGISVESFIPNRFEHGYGLSMNILFALQNADLIITVDNGINANDVATWCKENNKTLIITDHHTASEPLPEAFAIINPKKSNCNFCYDDICGAQVAWYFIAGIKKEMGLKVDLKQYLGLVAIAIIADVMPLVHINRTMVIAGLKVIENSKKECFMTLKRHFNSSKFSSTDIAFFIAPMINSAGRIKDAKLAFDFLRSNEQTIANVNLHKLLETNETRKITEAEITNEAMNKIVNIDDSILVAIGDEWHEGVVGIVASRVMRRYDKPVIVLCRGEDGILKGSGRSTADCDLYGSLNNCSEYLEKFGGHKLAIGLSIKDENIKQFVTTLARNFKINDDAKEESEILGELALTDINTELIDILDKYEPYGERNRTPLFISSGLSITNSMTMGTNKEHIRYSVSDKNSMIQAVEFRYDEILSDKQNHTICYSISKNSFRGVESLQLLIKNINK